jgi:DNA primase large subunit
VEKKEVVSSAVVPDVLAQPEVEFLFAGEHHHKIVKVMFPHCLEHFLAKLIQDGSLRHMVEVV